jgi:hypothetical protein
MNAAARMNLEAIPSGLKIKPEFTVKALGKLQIRHDQIETIKRMHAEFARTTMLLIRVISFLLISLG